MARSFKRLIDNRKKTTSYKVERIKLSIALAINRLILSSGISKKDLAEKIEVSPAYISKALKGDVNFTIETLVKLTDGLDSNIHINFTHKDNSFRWFEIIPNKTFNQEMYTMRDNLKVVKNFKPSVTETKSKAYCELSYAAA